MVARSVPAPLRRAARRIRDAWRSSSLVLLYHRVATVPHDPWGLCVRPAHFEEHLAVLARRRVVGPLAELVAAVARGRRQARRVVLTFDDGYAEVASRAVPALERHGLPATVFVTTDAIDGEREFWWDELERIVLDRQVGAGNAERIELYHALHTSLARLGPTARRACLARLLEWAGEAPLPRQSHRPLDVAGVRVLAASPCVTLGAHSVHHPYLSRLPEAEQRAEVVESRRRLEDVSGRPVVDFAYPHGDHDQRTIALVRAAGYRSACSTHAATAWARSDVFALPRVEAPDVDGEAFARWLDQWMGRAAA
jgi:peptidoglycan/xylan/chitin deacetylase (PgdA/CDA1 family)